MDNLHFKANFLRSIYALFNWQIKGHKENNMEAIVQSDFKKLHFYNAMKRLSLV